MKVLLIEDELLIQKALKTLMEKRGAQVDVTSQGREAIQMIKKKQYDRIITDLMLNDITGFDIIEETRTLFSPVEITNKFRVITAYSSSKIIDNLAKYEVQVYHKPFEALNKTIQQLMELNEKDYD